MKKSITLGSLLFFIVMVCACKKDQLGGSATIKGEVLHHAKLIPGARVFIKFNATDFPGTDTTLYDAKVVADANANYMIKCYKGNYFLYGVGYDDQLKGPVTGGLAVNIRNKETLNINVAVTE